MLTELKQKVLEANLDLKRYNLVLFTWGNVSGIDREQGMVVIKPSGVPYDKLTAEMMVVLDFTGNIIEGDLNPSSDTPTHLELYRNFPTIGGIVHTHSTYATSWAQAGKGISCYGTTQADYMYGTIPCARSLTDREIAGDYELNTGKVIVETFKNIDYLSIPAVLVANHGPFTWGKNPAEAVHNSVVLEETAKMAAITNGINAEAKVTSQTLLDKHYFRKHGANASYGQTKI